MYQVLGGREAPENMDMLFNNHHLYAKFTKFMYEINEG